ncbi:late competence development ComFB family protein [Candidatus Reidiella endopervernicosa]|nr:late competence development ComFB family protein [Candidatus Reidiella endopervernicosa]QKQ25929.1 late competence development ComFB family protein [Candidatus Reidiella endopervernicosa]
MYEEIQNYYEQLVVERIRRLAAEGETPNSDDDYLEDVACVALNQLPARYVRHKVDLVFYMPSEERFQMMNAVEEAVKTAIEYVEQHRGTSRPNTYAG